MAWDTRKIDQVCLQTGPEGLRVNPDRDLLYVNALPIDSSRNVVVSNSELAGSEHPRRMLNEIREGDILISTVHPRQNIVAMVPPELDGQIASREFCVLRPNVELIEKKFLFYFVTSQQFFSLLTSKVRGKNYPHVLERDIKEIDLPLPDLIEQRRIVEIIDEVNELRINSTKVRENYLRVLLALFHEYFGDPTTNPKGWPTMSLEETTTDKPQYGVHAKATGWTDGMPRYVRSSDITGEGRLQNSKIVSLDTDNWASFMLHPGDLLFATLGPVERTYIHQHQDGTCVYARNLVRIQINREQVLPWYLFALTKTEYYKRCIEMRKTPSNFPQVNLKELLQVRIPIPPMSRQNVFVRMIENLSEIRDKQNSTIKNIQRIYGITLQRAFSGKLTAN